jgi:very-short-patch-repair endonuclease
MDQRESVPMDFINKDRKGFDIEKAMRELPDYSPCDSPIEDIFYLQIQKYLSSGCKINRQFECKTKIGTFYLDFLIQIDGRNLGFECDGKDYHTDIDRDEKRDQAIIEAGLADRIFRVRGRDIVYHLPDCLDIIREVEPSLISERGHLNIKQLATRENERDDMRYGNTSRGFVVMRFLTAEYDGEHDHTVMITWFEKTPEG